MFKFCVISIFLISLFSACTDNDQVNELQKRVVELEKYIAPQNSERGIRWRVND